MRKLSMLAFALCLLLGSVGIARAQASSTGPEDFSQVAAATGDYTTCMNYCMNDGHGHSFEFCHLACEELANNS